MAKTLACSSSARVLSSAGSTAHDTLLIGLDWGTNVSSLHAAQAGSTELLTQELVPTLVGYVNDNVLEGIIPGNAKILFGKQAQKHRQHVRLVRPLRGGVIAEREAARDFVKHLRTRLPENTGEMRAVIGMPASSDLAARENARSAVQGIFSKVIFVPEPFLAALGYREESRLNDPEYLDPVLNSLYIDIGAGSTDVCLVQGRYPTVDDQLSVPFAGDAVDQVILDAALARYPDSGLTLNKVREVKERHSFVMGEEGQTTAMTTVMVGGKPNKIDLTEAIAIGCETLLEKTFVMTRELIGRADPDTVSELLQNVIVTGGGSQIRGFAVALQTKLLEEGFEGPSVRVLGADYKDYVARGALKTARQAQERHWQHVIGE
jgi:rod shape-determining protein MreB and related proteins